MYENVTLDVSTHSGKQDSPFYRFATNIYVNKTRQLIPGMEPQRLNKTKLKNNDIYRQLHRDVRLSLVQLQLMLRIQLI